MRKREKTPSPVEIARIVRRNEAHLEYYDLTSVADSLHHRGMKPCDIERSIAYYRAFIRQLLWGQAPTSVPKHVQPALRAHLMNPMEFRQFELQIFGINDIVKGYAAR